MAFSPSRIFFSLTFSFHPSIQSKDTPPSPRPCNPFPSPRYTLFRPHPSPLHPYKTALNAFTALHLTGSMHPNNHHATQYRWRVTNSLESLDPLPYTPWLYSNPITRNSIPLATSPSSPFTRVDRSPRSSPEIKNTSCRHRSKPIPIHSTNDSYLEVKRE